MTRTTSLLLWGLACVALVVLLVLLSAYWAFDRRVATETEALFAQGREAEGKVVTEAMLQDLPAPVQRYLRYAGVIGKPIPRTVRLKQVGRMRQNAEQPWAPLDAEQYYTVRPPGFVWVGTVRSAGLPVARARDQYVQGMGAMLVKMASLVTIIDATGEEMRQGAQMRYLNEATMWFPAALLGGNFSFDQVDDHSARVTFADSGKSVTATLYVDDEGKPTDFVAPRYRTVGDRFELELWSTPITGYGMFQGLRLPVRGKGVTEAKRGDLEYIDLTITELEYDAGGLY